jgi:hypothetical protein
MRPDFRQKLETFVEGCKRIRTEFYAANGFKEEGAWNVTWLKRWVRIENPGAYCFVDIETGEVLKPSGWKRPAITKTKRGNIFDECNGLQYAGPYGIALADEIKRSVA